MADVEQRLLRVLGGWAAGSVAAGALLSVQPTTRGFGRQTLAWGAVVVQGAFLLALDTTAASALRR